VKICLRRQWWDFVPKSGIFDISRYLQLNRNWHCHSGALCQSSAKKASMWPIYQEIFLYMRGWREWEKISWLYINHYINYLILNVTFPSHCAISFYLYLLRIPSRSTVKHYILCNKKKKNLCTYIKDSEESFKSIFHAEHDAVVRCAENDQCSQKVKTRIEISVLAYIRILIIQYYLKMWGAGEEWTTTSYSA